jgi:hypothetical protein
MIKRILFLGLLLCFSSVYAWNAAGHEVVAQIAYDNLTPQARQNVDNIMNDFSKDYPNVHSFLQIGPWADSLREQDLNIYNHWHYIDQSYSADNTPLVNLVDSDNVVFAINSLMPIFKNSRANPTERARALAFLVHLVGDVHQPLHAVSRISAQHPQGDQGGNLFYVSSGARRIDTTNLHSVWDKGCDLLLVSNDDEVKSLSTKIQADYPQSDAKLHTDDLAPQDWANESFSLAKSFVYSTPEAQAISQEYKQSCQQYSEQRLALAGYRLARVLNQLLS